MSIGMRSIVGIFNAKAQNRLPTDSSGGGLQGLAGDSHFAPLQELYAKVTVTIYVCSSLCCDDRETSAGCAARTSLS
jgi:hypothetical protein